jgi:hypothetical protein
VEGTSNGQDFTNPVTDQVAYVKLGRNEWAGLSGGHFIGRVVGDYAVGFEAVPLDGRRFVGSAPFVSVEDAFEFLALDFAFHYGEVKVSA